MDNREVFGFWITLATFGAVIGIIVTTNAYLGVLFGWALITLAAVIWSYISVWQDG